LKYKDPLPGKEGKVREVIPLFKPWFWWNPHRVMAMERTHSSVHLEIGIFVLDQGARKNITGMCLIFRALFFECNADIGQKDHFWMGTS
jgi:hypothetical protein